MIHPLLQFRLSHAPANKHGRELFMIYDIHSGQEICGRPIQGGVELAEIDAFLISSALNHAFCPSDITWLRSDPIRWGKVTEVLIEFRSGFCEKPQSFEPETGAFSLRSACGSAEIPLVLLTPPSLWSQKAVEIKDAAEQYFGLLNEVILRILDAESTSDSES